MKILIELKFKRNICNILRNKSFYIIYLINVLSGKYMHNKGQGIQYVLKTEIQVGSTNTLSKTNICYICYIFHTSCTHFIKTFIYRIDIHDLNHVE